ncbi:peptidoglycan editing factor PgeF [Ramlibacter humi]|uniref:Purine nucleoside phosphorylase n=1 Tax=Ramlibacter humi TaxID=2530451 RepID=A0A4Z0CB50_9BURK|nr:peptidoglycan editing factor PgeF [Ramlibacter humi]TFZ08551.1 peptidoglycan editing factor PgeF [Ramlibacter humi]
MQESWLTPDWPAPPNVRALCSLRAGGVSQGPYESLNLGDHVGDDAAAVRENRARFAARLQSRPVFLQQVHGTGVVELKAATPDATSADACWTRERGVACTIMVADCLPILFADREGQSVAAAHAGWRGLAGGVIEAAWNAFAQSLGVTKAEALERTLVWLGPCIGPAAFEVGDDVRQAFGAEAAVAGRFQPHSPGKWLANLPRLTRDRLAAIGIEQVHGNDGGADWCTVSNPSRFFSHRRDRVSGRFAAAAWLA